MNPTWRAESITTPPILRLANTRKNRALSEMTFSAAACLMSMRSKMWLSESTVPDGLKYRSIWSIISKPFPSKWDSSTKRSEIGGLM